MSLPSNPLQAKVLYHFDAQPGTSELTIYVDEILTITQQNIGEGWWMGTNERGESGHFPACYVQIIEETEQPATYLNAPPSIPDHVRRASQTSSFFTPAQANQFRNPDPNLNQETHNKEEPDWPDEDWDDDDDSGDNATDYGTQISQRGYPTGLAYTTPAGTHGQQATDLNVATANLSLSDNRLITGTNATKSKSNFSRFSNFSKSGLENYLLANKTINVPLENMVSVQYDPELGIIWKPILNHYTCAVTKHGKESKMAGFKTYISYDITPSTNNIVVRRRYKHFDWLNQRLGEKFLVVPLPPLPDKQITGRFQEDFVEHRRNLLQLWVNYICRHPVLSQCDVWWHFMSCTADEDMRGWKQGKRKAEKDQLVGSNFFFSVEIHPNNAPLDHTKTSKQLDNFQRFVAKFDEAVRHLYTTSVEQSKKISTIYSRDYKKLSESIRELSSAFQSGTAWRNSLGLNEAIRQTGAAYEEISKLHEEEPRYDFEPMADILHQYKGLLSGWPEILQLHRNSFNTKQEQERLFEEGKVSEADLARVKQRVNVITYSTLAEINHFHNERLIDFKQMMQVFLTAQINFHTDILSKLHSALNKINDA